jgi:hypothetical protein
LSGARHARHALPRRFGDDEPRDAVLANGHSAWKAGDEVELLPDEGGALTMRLSVVVSALVLSSMLVAFAPEAHAEPTSRFREGGSVVLDDVLGAGFAPGALAVSAGWVSYTNQRSSFAGSEMRTTGVSFAPTADVFLGGGFSIGGRIYLTRYEQEGFALDHHHTIWSRGVTPRIGYAFALADDVFLWPRLHAGVSWSGSESRGIAGAADGSPAVPFTSRSEATGLTLAVDAPVIFAVARHVALGVGPEVRYSRFKSEADESRALHAGVRGALTLVF